MSSHFKAVVEAISSANREPGWLKDFRLAALDRFNGMAQPLGTDDEWRRVDMRKFLFSDLSVPQGAVSVVVEPKPWHPALLSATPKEPLQLFGAPQSGVQFSTLSQAAATSPELVKTWLEKSLSQPTHLWHVLSHALWNGGVFLHVAKGVRAELPLGAVHTAFLNPASGTRAGSVPFTLVVLEEGASAVFVSDELSAFGAEGVACGATRIVLKPNARLSYLKVQRMEPGATALSELNADVDHNAALNLLALGAGSGLAKSRWTANIVGSGALVNAFGLVRGEKTQHFDETVLVEHLAPASQSRVLFKTALNGKSRSMFTGLIRVPKIAQKTDAYQTNRNLLLSREARADTIPKLEIIADDVKCGHGAAVSNIDEENLFYLMSRGLTRSEAEALIVAGFYEDVVNQWVEQSPLADPSREPERTEIMAWVSDILIRSKTAVGAGR